MDAKPNEGWATLLNSKKAHYFDASGRSLCGHWLYLGNAYDANQTPGSPDDCAACARKLAKRTAPDAPPATAQEPPVSTNAETGPEGETPAPDTTLDSGRKESTR